MCKRKKGFLHNFEEEKPRTTKVRDEAEKEQVHLVISNVKVLSLHAQQYKGHVQITDGKEQWISSYFSQLIFC